MSKLYEIAFKINAAMAGSFKSSMAAAAQKIGVLDKQLSTLEQHKKKADRFRSLTKEITQVEQNFAQAQDEVKRLKKELDSTSKPTKKMQANFNLAAKNAKKLKDKLAQKKQTLHELRTALGAAGLKTRQLSTHYGQLAKSIEKARRAQDKFLTLQGKKRKNEERRETYRAKLLDAAALGASVVAPVMVASKIEDAQIRLSTVINDKNKSKAMAEANAHAKKLAQAGTTAFDDAYNIQYALNSAGLSATAARVASGVVAKVARVTAGVPESVGEVVATAYNNLGNQLEGTTEQKINKIADMLTKVQFKYQLRDFSQLGESIKKGASSLGNYNINVMQGAVALGLLNSAGRVGSEAGTSFAAVTRNLNKAQRELNAEIVRGENGQMDLVATLGNIKEALDETYGDDIDARAEAIQKIFGDEGKEGIVPLLDKLNELKEGYEDISKNSDGLVNKEFEKFLNSTSGQMTKFSGNLAVLNQSVAGVLLPTINRVLSAGSFIVSKIAVISAKFPKLTALVVGGAAAAATLGVATIGLGYAFSIAKGGILGFQAACTLMNANLTKAKIQTVALGIVQKGAAIATKLWTGAQWLLNAAMSANPIGLVVAGAVGLAAAGVWLYRKWEPFRILLNKIGKFLWTGLKLSPIGLMVRYAMFLVKLGKKALSGWKPFAGLMVGLWEKIKTPLRWMGKFLGFGKNKGGTVLQNTKAAQTAGSNIVKLPKANAVEQSAKAAKAAGQAKIIEYEAARAKAMPGPEQIRRIEPSSSATVQGSNIVIHINPTIHIAPGNDEQKVKSAVNESMKVTVDQVRSVLAQINAKEQRLSYA
ncbi:MAG: phage tail tape measure protein [Desulfobacteraceae bacterium]|nr:phage tail tape measure protein [Desulfobacteraceae bacterium]